MSENGNKPNMVSAFPTKSFFVGMLTRDIDLQDAALDLLDNTVDGILRSLKEKGTDSSRNGKPYSSYWATIDFDASSFRIADNCGGIPRRLAEEHAFRLGSPDLERDRDIPTVGMYGIGMKRAIFKMGRPCTVTTRHKSEAYRVKISPDWLADDADWYLPIETVSTDGLAEGTVIEIKDLHEPISHLFSKNSAFADEFNKTVSTHYSYIIHKGFKVKINKKPIEPRPISIAFTPPEKAKKNKRIAPFIYEGTVNEVDVRLIVGLYRDLPTDEEIEADLEGKSGSKENAGWTIICNDRVVVYCDKTRLTGWGETGIPMYHSQFIAIAGVVHFRSADASKLPVTTTKRGIDAASDTYLIAKDIMKEGLKTFTSFTYKWKSPSQERDEIENAAEAVDVFEVSKLIPDQEWSEVRKHYGGKKFVPQLPTPTEINPTKMIRFSRTLDDIRMVSEAVLGDADKSPAEVGAKCFDDTLSKVKRIKKG